MKNLIGRVHSRLVESIQEKSDWSRAFNQFTIECDICSRYCIYHDKFNVCLVTKPLGVFSSETEWLNVFFCLLFKKCIIKQLLNSVFAWYHELSKPRVCIICRSLRLRQTTQTSVLIIRDIMLNLIQNCLISRAWSAWASHVSEIPITENLFFILANANSWSSCHNFDSGYGYSNGVTKSKLNYQKSQFCPYDSLNLCSV